MPAALDFFKYAQGGPSKRKVEGFAEKSSKRRKVDAHESDDESDLDVAEDPEELPPMFRHRVKTTGDDVPEHLAAFDDMQTRYNVPPRILSNLTSNGFITPTGIQAYGIPILLAASSFQYNSFFSQH